MTAAARPATLVRSGQEALMTTVNVLEAKTNLSKLIEAVESGREREIVIARNGKPAVRLVPLEEKQVLRFGVLEGKVHYDEELDKELDAEIAEQFRKSGWM